MDPHGIDAYANKSPKIPYSAVILLTGRTNDRQTDLITQMSRRRFKKTVTLTKFD